jgi:uncharacterized membrane protein YfcA
MLALLAGQALAGKLDDKRLQQAFAWLTLAVALLMAARTFGWTSS